MSQHIWPLLACITIALLLSVIYKQDQRISSLSSVIEEKSSEVSYYKNENGKIVAEKKAAEITASELRKMYPEIQKSIAKDFGIKVKDLKLYMESQFKSTGGGKAEVHNHYYPDEKTSYTEISANDGYLEFKGKVYDSLTASYQYSYTDTIKQTMSMKRDWILGNQYLYGSATLSNPNAKVTGGKAVLMKDYKDKRWGVGVGLFYDGRPRLGLGIQYNVVRF